MMKRTLGCAALSCAVGLVDAKALKWSDDSPRWVPARETQLGLMAALALDPPVPTAAPETPRVRKALEARDATDNTCGFISGVFTSSLYCETTASCMVNTIHSHVGCCGDVDDCTIQATCYDSTESESYTTNDGRTLWCGRSEYPYCISYIYQDPWFSGYTALGCGATGGTTKVWYTAFDTSSSTSSSSTSESSTTTSTSASTLSTSTSSDSSTSTSSSSSESSSPSSSSTAPVVPPEPDRGPPVGAIVGGVVGGLGAIALIVLGVWAVLRQRNKQKNLSAAPAAGGAMYPPPAAPGAGGPPYQGPHMSQVPPQAYLATGGAAPGAGFDPRASMAPSNVGTASAPYGAPPYDQKTATGSASPAASPPIASFYDTHHTTPSPPLQGQEQQYGQHAYANVPPSAVPPGTQPGPFVPSQPPYPQAYGPAQQGPPPVELPATRGDGELRELQG
ncbi:hypothetical protein VTH06DRAFT_1329 [Thermothelomyces fergusii]